MKFSALACFGLAFSATLCWKSQAPPSASSLAPLPPVSSLSTSTPARATGRSGTTPDPAPAPDLPYSKQEEDRLLGRCHDLTASDPEAAFRAGMARWGFDENALANAAKALIQKDPAAARRLLQDCPDLRSKSVLESELMADEVSRNPKEKLQWADMNLEGYVKRKTLNAGIKALAEMDPAAALEIVAGWPPTLGKVNGQIQALGRQLKADPAAALTWAAENLGPSERKFIGLIATMSYLKENPGQGMALLPQLPLEYQQHLGFAMASASKRDASQSLPQMMDTIRSLPGEIQTSVIRSIAQDFQTGPAGEEKTATSFLAALTAPDERAAVIEVMVVERLAYFHGSKEPSKILDSLGQFQTPEDKQAAARVVPYLPDLTEAQRSEILARLK